MKGPPGKKRLMDPSTAHQIFGRAGRPQFDTQGYVFVPGPRGRREDRPLAREVRPDPRGHERPGPAEGEEGAEEEDAQAARRPSSIGPRRSSRSSRRRRPANLASRGPLPWRLLAYMLDASPEVDLIRDLVGKRLMDPKHLEAGPEDARPDAADAAAGRLRHAGARAADQGGDCPGPSRGPRGREGGRVEDGEAACWRLPQSHAASAEPEKPQGPPPYKPMFARPTERLAKLSLFRGVNPLYGVFLVNQLGIADRAERIQAMESVLELPGSVAHFVRVPRQDQLAARPAGHHAAGRAAAAARPGHGRTNWCRSQEERDPNRFRSFDEEPVWVLTLADKLRRLFDYDFPGVHDLRTTPVWAAGEVLELRRLQQVRHQQEPSEAGRHDLPPPPAADPAGRRVHPALAARTARRTSGAPTWTTSPTG